MEKMTEKERETLKALQAKAKRVQRAEAEFFEEADQRKEELLKRWGYVLQKKPKASSAPIPPVQSDNDESIPHDNANLIQS